MKLSAGFICELYVDHGYIQDLDNNKYLFMFNDIVGEFLLHDKVTFSVKKDVIDIAFNVRVVK